MFLGAVADSDRKASDLNAACSAELQALAELRESALRTTIRLTTRLCTMLAVADVAIAHDNGTIDPNLKASLMRAIRALHGFRHDLLRIDVQHRWS